MTTLRDFLTSDWINPFQLCHIVDRDTNKVLVECFVIRAYVNYCDENAIDLNEYYVYDVYAGVRFGNDHAVTGCYEIQVSKE